MFISTFKKTEKCSLNCAFSINHLLKFNARFGIKFNTVIVFFQMAVIMKKESLDSNNHSFGYLQTYRHDDIRKHIPTIDSLNYVQRNNTFLCVFENKNKLNNL